MSGEEETQESQRIDCKFEWDDQSQLYYHASSRFYYDPVAGWYYNTHDGSYYKFDNGTYVLLQESHTEEENLADESNHTEPCHDSANNVDVQNPPPPSEWLEETLINIYLAGYSSSAANADDDTVVDSGCDSELLAHGAEDENICEIEECERTKEDPCYATESSERISDEGVSWEEENWRAQYGQVVQSTEEVLLASSVIDLWDWEVITETVVKKKKRGKKRNCLIARLIGKLVKPSAKLHPSMPSSVRLYKTAAICEANFDLVRVSSGKMYRLKNPSLKFLSSLSTYDSSNPTKDWGVPDLSNDEQSCLVLNSSESCDKETQTDVAGSTELPDPLMTLEKNKGPVYRDRAAERRTLHGGYGLGPGQKNQCGDGGQETSPVSVSTEEAAAEALHMSFGAGSYARRVLEKMGWKEGDALGKTSEGIRQPLEAVGNKGFAGLGWNQHRLIYR